MAPVRLDPFRNIVNVQWTEETTTSALAFDHCWTTYDTWDETASSYYWGPPDYLNQVNWTRFGIVLTPASCPNGAVIAAALAQMEIDVPKPPGGNTTDWKFYNGLWITWNVGPTGLAGDAITDVGGYRWRWNAADSSCGPYFSGPEPGPPGPDRRPTY